jgi:glucose-1-phosphate thymidylyltransferase
VHAILLCAGFGTRLHPLTRDVAKPLLPVAGKPIVEYLVEQLAATQQIDDLLLVSNARFATQFGEWRDRVAPKWPGLRIEILDDGATANEHRLGAVRDLAFALRERAASGPALVSAGDNLFDYDLSRILDDYAKNPRNLVLAYRETDRRRLRRTGVAELGADGRIVRLWEKPAEPASDWACPALYVLEPEALAVVPRFLDEQPDADAPGAWIGWLVERQPIFAHAMRGRRLDIGDLESYQAAGAWIAQAGPGLRPLTGGARTET